jgi:2-methylcitrate dehydratase PrpD
MNVTSPFMDRLVRIGAPRSLEVGSELQRRSAQVVVDTLAVVARGMEDQTCAAYGRAVGWRAGRARTPEESALVNALATTVLQMDEGHRESRGHPAIHVVPAAVAVAAEADASGDELLAAVVAGYETAVEIGMVIQGMPAANHPHGSWATFGAAIAAANLWGADEAQRRTVLDAVASLRVHPMRGPEHTGATVHHFYAGTGVQTAISLARGAVEGMTAPYGALESYYLPAFQQGSPDDTPAAHGAFAILGNYFKFYAACGHLHTALKAVERIVAQNGLGLDVVEAVVIDTYRAASLLDEREPATNLAARFSLPFLVGRILARGGIGHRAFTDEDLRDERTLKAARLVELRHEKDLEPLYPASRPADVTVRTVDGGTHAVSERDSFGDVTNPAPFETWVDKCCALLGEERGRLVAGFVDENPTTWKTRDLLDAVWG